MFFLDHLARHVQALRDASLYKEERVLTSPQDAVIQLEDGREVINLCANNYLGLANHPDIVRAAGEALPRAGFGLSSVRFICGTTSLHKELERRLSRFLGTEDTILYSSCFDANGGLFEALLGEEDAVISDALNHASIIDGIRLSKAARFRYRHADMTDLERQLEDAHARPSRFAMVATDGVFSMDGEVARLDAICEAAAPHDALVMVDDSHGVGVLGHGGRGTPEAAGVVDRVDILTGTLGKALGGASGGYTSGRGEIVEWLRQRSRPYLFSNSLAPVVAAASIAVLDLIERRGALRQQLEDNTTYFRARLAGLGFRLGGAGHPIIPVMLGEAALASRMADRLLDEGIYAIGFSYPVVPQGQSRIRTQMSAAHTRAHLDRAVSAFESVGRSLGVIA
jgi:glycine C-acetyltransferase